MDTTLFTDFKEVLFAAGGAMASGAIVYLKTAINKKAGQESDLQISVNQLSIRIIELSNRVQITESNLTGISDVLNKLNESAKKDEFRHKLKVIISDTYNSILVADDDMHEDVRSLIIESERHTYEFFKSIYYLGYENIDINLIKEKALQVFRMLRRLKEPGITDEMAEAMQNNVAYPAINHLAQKLAFIKTKKYNGNTDNKFIEAATEYILEVSQGAISISKR